MFSLINNLHIYKKDKSHIKDINYNFNPLNGKKELQVYKYSKDV